MSTKRNQSSSMRVVTRRKVLIIPYIGKNMDKVLMVKDVRTNEWGFISGGVKKKESSFEAAERELAEETSGLMTKIDPKKACIDVFYTLYRPQELLKIDKSRREIVRSMYTVYMYEIESDPMIHRFSPNKEVNDVQIKPFAEFSNVWTFCDDFYKTQMCNVLKNNNYKIQYNCKYEGVGDYKLYPTQELRHRSSRREQTVGDRDRSCWYG